MSFVRQAADAIFTELLAMAWVGTVVIAVLVSDPRLSIGLGVVSLLLPGLGFLFVGSRIEEDRKSRLGKAVELGRTGLLVLGGALLAGFAVLVVAKL